MPDNFETEASKEDPDGFAKLEALTKKLLKVKKTEVEGERKEQGPDANPS